VEAELLFITAHIITRKKPFVNRFSNFFYKETKKHTHNKLYLLTFGMQTFTLEIQSGRMDGEVKKDKWRILSKKDYSRRYKTACLEAVFESYEPNFIHVDDFIMYAGEVGTQEENQLQNSYFQNDIKKMKEQNN